MAFDLDALRAAVTAQGRVMRVGVAEVKGSAPREVGASMLVWNGGQSGTIGGGALEFAAAQRWQEGLSHHPLGPALGQCCGGAVTLLTEIYDKDRVARLSGDVLARPVRAEADRPLAVKRVLARARDRGELPTAQLIDGWMIEPIERRVRPVWIWGAGHVGRALVGVLHPLPDLALTWVDTAPERFPSHVPDGVDVVSAADPAALVPHAPALAHHVILTYSHALDLTLCHALLDHGFARAGLIGSATKWARFRARLASLGHSGHDIARIECPIGEPKLGKHPQAIALGVATGMLRADCETERREAQA